MSLLNDILNWSNSDLTMWQRDALRRLVQKHELESHDFEDLYAMLKSEHGLSDPQHRQPVPIAKDHISAQVSNGSTIILRALRDLEHVNRIASGQKLSFAADGITVIYGRNASGKSGYSRVLKRACRARDLSETIHPNAFDSKATGDIPEAIFDIESKGQVRSLCWKRGETPPDDLSTISVFDSRCARAYLDTEQDAAYLPYGLDVVENLGRRVLSELTSRLSTEIATINTDTSPFADLVGETAVGKIIASLSATTDQQKISELSTLTGVEIERLTELEKALSENDPKAKAKALRLSAQRIDDLIARIDSAVTHIDNAAIEKFRGWDKETQTASQAETIAAVKFRSGELLLPGTGEQTWKSLFEVARRFSNEIAYPTSCFPYVDSGALCPLCQRQFDEETAKRMQRFDEFVSHDTANVAAEKRRFLEEKIRTLKSSVLGFRLDGAIEEEIKQLDASLLLAIQTFEKKVEFKKTWLLGACETHVWDNPPLLDCDPRANLKSLSKQLVGQAADLDKASDEQKKKELEAERAELRSRTSLAPRLKAILNVIQQMQIKEKLVKCKDDLRTKPISDKAKELASQAITTALKDALNTEFLSLGVGHIKIKLNERAEQGRMKHKLVLDLPVTRKLDEILSEGEQRAIAIGSFLAELHLAGHKGGIVFDDPVSSLDHHWRKKVARRLVEESKNRQVIILTHDTTFLGELRDEIELQKVNHLMQHLEWMDGSSGHISDGLPWEHQSYKERLDKHEKEQRVLEASWPPYPSESDRNKMRMQYNHLRATIERVIQDVVFNGVVQRYRDWIKVNMLDDVAGLTKGECSEIIRLHKACCDVVDAHDPSSAKDAPVPDAKQLGKDIQDLKLAIECIRTRRKPQIAATSSPKVP